MKNLTQKLLLLALLPIFSVNAQTIANFENINIPPAGFVNDAGLAGFFFSGNAALPNFYDPNFQYWEGWAISNVTDNTTPGFTNQYSAIAGGGASGTSNYAVGYAFSPVSLFLNGPAKGGTLSGIYVTNDTYTYYSMREGDSFSKKFGGETGNDPDFLKLTIHGYNGTIATDSIIFYLADYRFSNNAQDYIVKDWTYIDLKPMGNVEEITFSLSSSDNGQFGMNTPAYFCADQLVTDDNTTDIHETAQSNTLKVSPNPAHDFIRLEWPGNEPVVAQLYNSMGNNMRPVTLLPGMNTIDLQGLPVGMYYLNADLRVIRFSCF